MKEELKIVEIKCEKCGRILMELPSGLLRCNHCEEIKKILLAIKEVSGKLEIIIKRSQRGNL